MPEPKRSSSGSEDRAGTLFASWLARLEAGEEPDFAALCRDHATHARRLQELHDSWLEVDGLRRLFGLAGTVAERLKGRFGSEVDPEIELEGESPASQEFSAQVLERLAGHGERARRYRFKSEIAHGGMGKVLKVWDEDLRRHLAMKVMLGKGALPGEERAATVDAGQLARFLEEAQVTGQLDHPGIVPVHELGLDAEGHVYFTMKLVKGRTLRTIFDLVREGREGWTQVKALGVLLKACEAMAYAHDKGVIHRDLKPANVMVGRYGEVFVMDWGLAKILGRDDAKDIRVRTEAAAASLSQVHSDRREHLGEAPDSPLYTMDGDVVGTPAYMSPEQASGRVEEMGPHSDVYGLGAMLYHLLAGHMPYVPPGGRMVNYAVLALAQERPPRPLHETAPSAPQELVAICEQAMARDPRRRYPDMNALAADLAAYLEGRVVHAFEVGAWAEARKWVRRNKSLAAALCAALALFVGGLAGIGYVQARGREIAELERRRADDKALEAQRSEAEAQDQRLRAEAETAKVLRLSDVKRLAELSAQADALWPPHPERIGELDAWLDRARAPLRNLDLHRATLQEMRASAPSAEMQWQHDVLTELIAGLEGLAAGLLTDEAVGEPYGWSIPKRLAFARDLQAGFAPGGELARRWEAALPAIRDVYGSPDLAPQMGLSPLGPDPQTGLWEFAHLMTGSEPRRDGEGKLVLSEETGIVLVLLPGERFTMGSQAHDPSGANFDPDSQPDEIPVREVRLSSFLISKYEMTQGQWLRLSGQTPSQYGPDDWGTEWLATGAQATLMHPVERISWLDCLTWLSRAGLCLPSEAQWEYAARGGTVTAWWSGRERESLRGAANLQDSFSMARGGQHWLRDRHEMWLDDGSTVHAPVGAYAANPLGLHDVMGNVSEWCLDGYFQDSYRKGSLEDPVVSWVEASICSVRGGSFSESAYFARSACRVNRPPGTILDTTGVRPARSLAR